MLTISSFSKFPLIIALAFSLYQSLDFAIFNTKMHILIDGICLSDVSNLPSRCNFKLH